ncbi:MAG: hypothetical protein JWL84_1877, partial [Rhodospirillales bacterium]|nr:hypothetical protein [Rhodospirillales bacterium]
MRRAVIGGIGAAVGAIATQIPILDARRAGAEMYGAPRLLPIVLF